MPDYAARATYQPDIVIDAGGVIEKKLLACDAHASQFYEFAPWQGGFLDAVPDTWKEKREFILKHWDRFLSVSDEMRPSLVSNMAKTLQPAYNMQSPSKSRIMAEDRMKLKWRFCSRC